MFQYPNIFWVEVIFEVGEVSIKPHRERELRASSRGSKISHRDLLERWAFEAGSINSQSSLKILREETSLY